MTPPLADTVHVANTFARAGMLAPSRPDRALRALIGLHRWGPTLAAGYLGAAARYPDAAAVVDELGSITFAEIDARTNALARGLAGYGVRAGDGVAIICRNHRWFVQASIACSKLGAHAIFLNTSFAGPQVREVVAREGAVAIVYDEEFADVVADSREGRPSFLAWHDDAAAAADPTLEQLGATRATTALSPPAQPGRIVILTSGTTGSPKGANRASPSSLSPAAGLLSVIPLRARETTVIAAPLFHSWGFAHLALSTALSSTLVLQRRFDPLSTLRAVADHRAQALVVVPVMVQRMLELSDEQRSSVDLSSLCVIAASGSALPGPLAQRVMDAFGDVLYNLYGSTEVAWASIASPADLRAAPGTAGRPPRGTPRGSSIPRAASCRPARRGGSSSAQNYCSTGTPAAGQGARRCLHGDRRRRSLRHRRPVVRRRPRRRHDRVRRRERLPGRGRGPAGRRARRRRGGRRRRRRRTVRPAPLRVRRGYAGRTLSEAALQEHVRVNLARYKVPRDVVFVSELPRNATGKVLKRSLGQGY